ncbi:MAG: histone deacetylase family protein, partial [Afipia sp.]|nr:histone deacetylase family protein [Afipia sp.]
MSTLLLTHTASSLNHKVGEGHPERPDRIRAMEKALSQDIFKPLVREEAPMGDIETVKLCHDES